MSRLSVSDNGDGAPTCCVALRPSIILRNLLVPEDMWMEFPRGLGYSITDYFLFQAGYPSERKYVTTPESHQLPYEDVWIHTKDNVKIHSFLITQEQPERGTAPTIMFFHGNAGNIGDRLYNAKLMYKDFKCNIFLVQYRGYGLSEGTPSEKGLFRDAQAALEYLEKREDVDSTKIFAFGRSLGGAVAIDLASRKKFRTRLAGLIVENTFTNIPQLAKHLFPWKVVQWLPGFFFKNRFESLKKVSSVMCPTLFIRGAEDEMMPEKMVTDLHAKCAAPLKRLMMFPDGDHNDTYQCEGYTGRVLEFIAEAIVAGDKGRTKEAIV